MEKRTAHYDLDAIKSVVAQRGVDAFTKTALIGMDVMGLTETEGLAVVLGRQRAMLFKSMTTNHDHRVWQDVYRAPCPNGKLAYIKLTIRDGTVVIQFKEL